MGMIIFLTLCIIEISLAAFCIRTKSDNLKTRTIVRISCLAVFALLAILPVIEWSFRYYALAALLILLSATGAITLISKKKSKKDFKAVRVILKAIGITALLFAVTLPAIIFPQNNLMVSATGEFNVSTRVCTYVDANRTESYSDNDEKRKLNVQFWYPDSDVGRYPLIVFSHGGLGVKSSNESLYNELASHGYVVCSIDHTFQCLYTSDTGGNLTLIDWDYMQELSTENAQSNIQQSYEYYQKWMKIRTEDIEFVLDFVICFILRPL